MKRKYAILALCIIIFGVGLYWSRLPRIVFSAIVKKAKSDQFHARSMLDPRSQKALAIANQSPAVQAFLSFYGKCEKCNPKFFEGKDNLIGCVEYRFVDPQKYNFARQFHNPVIVHYQVSSACSFRCHGIRQITKFPKGFLVAIDPEKGVVLEQSVPMEAIVSPQYCLGDIDCLCLSGSGRPFVGCSNVLHAPCAGPAGDYMCNRCRCVDHQCVTLEDEYKKECGAIWTIKRMDVKNEFFKNGLPVKSGLLAVDADFSKWSIVTRRADDGTMQPFVWMDGFSIEPGEQYCFGDGDHVMTCIEVVAIENETAFLNVREKHMPPPTHQRLAYDRTRHCRVDKTYIAP